MTRTLPCLLALGLAAGLSCSPAAAQSAQTATSSSSAAPASSAPAVLALGEVHDNPDGHAARFALLQARLAELGHRYGDFDAHDGLWDMAVRTGDSCLARMALVPRVLEARGLDVTPGMIARLRDVGDLATVAILETILREEVAHVAAGSRWFGWCCERDRVEPQATFAALLDTHLRGRLRGPFNVDARLRAGFTAAELDRLGELAA